MVAIFIVLAAILSGCQSVTRTEKMGENSAVLSYSQLELIPTVHMGFTVYLKRAEANGQLELCGFAVLKPFFGYDSSSSFSTHEADNYNQIFFKPLRIRIGQREVSRGGFIRVFEDLQDVEARCVLTNVPYEIGLPEPIIEYSRRTNMSAEPEWSANFKISSDGDSKVLFSETYSAA